MWSKWLVLTTPRFLIHYREYSCNKQWPKAGGRREGEGERGVVRKERGGGGQRGTPILIVVLCALHKILHIYY